MFARVNSMGLFGMDVYSVSVEVDLSQGMPAFDIVGLPDAAVKESKDRVRSAIKNNCFADCKLLQKSSKASDSAFPSFTTSTVFRFLQPENAVTSIFFKSDGIVMLVNPPQPENA